MEIRLDHSGDEPFEWSERWTPAPAELDHPDVVALGEVEAKGRITRLQAGFHLRATLTYRLTLRCVRCLGTALQPRTGTVELLVLVGPEEDHPQDLELIGDDLGVLRLPEPRLSTRRLWIEFEISRADPAANHAKFATAHLFRPWGPSDAFVSMISAHVARARIAN